jgi:RND family efflux transporter MFP subunit
MLFLCCASIYSAKPGPILKDPVATGKSSVDTSQSDFQNSAANARFSDYRMDAAIIRPYRRATVSSEVSGVIEARHVEEGDPVVGGQIIFEVSTETFKLAAERAQERLAALEAALRQARADLKTQEYLYSHKAATRTRLIKARAEAEIAAHKVNEAKIDLAFALRDLQNCRVKSPFGGYIITLYKERHESVQRFDELFLVADTSKVYAVVNVPEPLLSGIRKGMAALFTRPDGERHTGVVSRIAKPIDPSSKTKRVHILIDNSGAKLEMGMLGAVRLFADRELKR